MLVRRQTSDREIFKKKRLKCQRRGSLIGSCSVCPYGVYLCPVVDKVGHL